MVLQVMFWIIKHVKIFASFSVMVWGYMFKRGTRVR